MEKIFCFYTGIIFKRKNILKMILIGTFLIYIVGLLLPYLFASFKSANWITFGLMLLIVIYIWIKGSNMRKGKRI